LIEYTFGFSSEKTY